MSPTLYNALSTVVAVLMVIAAVVGLWLVALLATRTYRWLTDYTLLDARLDAVVDRRADYMEAEQDRRSAVYHGDEYAVTHLRYYGLRYVLTHKVFVQHERLTWALWQRARRERVAMTR